MISSGDKKKIGKKKNWGNLLSINRPIDRKKNRCGTYNFDFMSMMCGKAVYLPSCFAYQIVIDNGPAARTKFAQNIQKGQYFLLIQPGNTSLFKNMRTVKYKIQLAWIVSRCHTYSIIGLFIFLAGHDMGDPFEISTVRREVFDKFDY